MLEPHEVLHNEHTAARRTFTTLEVAPGRSALVPSGFFEIDGVRVGPTRHAPAIGEHNDEIYRAELGLSGGDLETLRQGRII